jgi:hypothetical protein
VEEVLQALIETASDLVREVTRRRFTVPRELGTTREFRTYGSESIYVDELVASADILGVVDESGNTLIYDADFDFTDPITKGATLRVARAGAYWLSGGLSSLPPDHSDLFLTELWGTEMYSKSPPKVFVMGNFGYAAVPKDIEFATRQAVAVWFREEISRYTADTFISRGRMFEPDTLPPLTMAKLRGAGWIVRDLVFT